MAFDVDPLSSGNPILGVGRVDLIADSSRGCHFNTVMSARYDPSAAAQRPFVGRRLERAVWSPTAPDALVIAHPDACALLPEEIRRGTPIIVGLRASQRLWAMVPSVLLRACWERSLPPAAIEPIEAEAMFLAYLTQQLLQAASPDELVWLSADSDRDRA